MLRFYYQHLFFRMTSTNNNQTMPQEINDLVTNNHHVSRAPLLAWIDFNPSMDK